MKQQRATTTTRQTSANPALQCADARAARTFRPYSGLDAGSTNGDAGRRQPPKRYYELGAGLTEYALLIALIALIGIASVRSLGQTIEATFQDATEEIGMAGVQ